MVSLVPCVQRVVQLYMIGINAQISKRKEKQHQLPLGSLCAFFETCTIHETEFLFHEILNQ